MVWDGQRDGPDRGCSWEGEEPFVKDLGLHTHASKAFPQDSVTWHNPFNPLPFQRSYRLMCEDMVSRNNTRQCNIRLLCHRVDKESKTDV